MDIPKTIRIHPEERVLEPAIEMKATIAVHLYLQDKLKRSDCPGCGTPLGIHETWDIDMYDHEHGWYLCEGLPKQWLSINCMACGYDTSLNKLGVSRYGDIPNVG